MPVRSRYRASGPDCHASLGERATVCQQLG
jgi:hypothetical protein